jgi:hypothetical protein
MWRVIWFGSVCVLLYPASAQADARQVNTIREAYVRF